MKRLLHIIFLAVLAVACTPELKDTGLQSADLEGKVLIDFNVQIPNVGPSTKAMAEKPAITDLMVAVFDTEGYLVEYAFASKGTEYATENGVECLYKVALTQSKEQRIIHFIGNAPEGLRFGTEETVLSYVKSELGSEKEDLYWCRRKVPFISGTNQTLDPVYQATEETTAAFDNIPLIRNFARISLVNAATSDFELESWTVVNTYKTGTCAAYNTSNGTFVDYFNYVDNPDQTLNQLGIKELGTPKTHDALLRENYRGNVPVSSEKVSVADAKSSLLNPSQYYYAYERDVTSDPAYIIAYGTYKGDGKNAKCYYKIGLYDNDGKSFPLLRNFQYTLTLTKVERPGYETFEEASTSTGSGNVSTAQETLSLVYISDGFASLSVDYIEKMIVEVPKDGVDLGFKFISDVENGIEGSLSNVRVVVNKPEGTAGAAIAKVNNADYIVDQKIKPTEWKLNITPVTPTAVPKKQSLTIYADYTRGEGTAAQTMTLQRTVTYIVWEKQSLTVECVPNEIPRERGADMDLQITLPGGLSSSMFPLDLKIEAEKLSITPNNEKDHMPVQSGKSIINSSKSVFYFIKTVQWEEYLASKLVTCYFKSNKDVSDSKVYVANDYFNTANGEFTTYIASHFENLRFNQNPVACVEDVPVNFSFTMDGTWNQPVSVYLGGLQPSEDDPNGLTSTNNIVDGRAEYVFTPTAANVTLYLQTIDEDSPLYVGLESNHYVSNYLPADRDWMEFTNLSIGPNRLLQGVGRSATISFRMDTGDADYANREVTVKLDGLAFADGKDTYTFKPVTSGNVTVTQNSNGATVTIGGLVTTIPGTVHFTVTAPGYKSGTAEKTRSWGSFGTLSYEYDGDDGVNYIPVQPADDVIFHFNLPADYYDENMLVNVELDGFVSVDDNLQPITRGASYIYDPDQAGEQSIRLRPSGSVAGTVCRVTISEPGYNNGNPVSHEVTQSDKVTKSATITFDNTSKRTERTNSRQRWADNDIVFVNEKNQSTTNVSSNYKPIRIYAGQSITVSVPDGGVITQIEFDCNSSDYAKTLQNSIGTEASRSSDKVTINLKGSSSTYNFSNFEGQVSLDAITVTYEIDL